MTFSLMKLKKSDSVENADDEQEATNIASDAQSIPKLTVLRLASVDKLKTIIFSLFSTLVL